ncbi:pyridoxal phosphate-dependent aminotransferase [Bacteroidota bacterium]
MQEVSTMAANLIGSEIIKLGAEITKRIREGQSIYNLTIGDFDPSIFPIPERLRDLIIEAYTKGETNYPPADGVPELKKAVQSFIESKQGISFGDDELLIAGGGRPIIHAIYQTLVDPGDEVIYPVPSWNNNHYCHLSGAVKREIQTRPEDGFLPTAAELKPHLKNAVILALCSPLNPTGTTFRKEQLLEICELVLEENNRRNGKQKPLYLLFDQIYWMLRVDGIEHINPLRILPELKPYTVFVDGISKSLAATGVRVGWSLGPAPIINRMKSIIGHIGAWAPRAEQVATAAFLNERDAMDLYVHDIQEKLHNRLNTLSLGIENLKKKGFPVNCIQPEGAIYLSVQFALKGKRKPDGELIETTQDITDYLLNAAKLAVVPFTAFGCAPGTDWYRVSVGTLKQESISDLLDKLEKALEGIS